MQIYVPSPPIPAMGQKHAAQNAKNAPPIRSRAPPPPTPLPPFPRSYARRSVKLPPAKALPCAPSRYASSSLLATECSDAVDGSTSERDVELAGHRPIPGCPGAGLRQHREGKRTAGGRRRDRGQRDGAAA